MTRSPVETVQSSGRFEIRVLTREEQAFRPAMSLVLSGSTRWSKEVAQQIESLEMLASRQGLRMDVLVGAYAPSGLISAALVIESPGRTAMVYTPPMALSEDGCAATVDVLVEVRLCAGLRGVRILQALLPPEDRDRPAIHASAGFWYLAELLYMDRPARLEGRRSDSPLAPRMLTYCEDRRALFLRALEESYVDSLDCPGLAGLRTTEDVLAGHAATGVYDARGWFVALAGERPVGVLLTSRVPNRSALEVIYMGVGAQARGQGVGDSLLARAVAFARAQELGDVTLAVDSSNDPARRFYERWQFAETSRRRAWVAALEA